MPSVPVIICLMNMMVVVLNTVSVWEGVLFGILQPVPSLLMTIVEVAPEPLIVICILLLIITRQCFHGWTKMRFFNHIYAAASCQAYLHNST